MERISLEPAGGDSNAGGVVRIIERSGKFGLAMSAQGLVPNTGKNAYAVWLSNSPTDSHLPGFVSPPVRSNGHLQTAGVIPDDWQRFQQVVVSLESASEPKAPSDLVLTGNLRQ